MAPIKSFDKSIDGDVRQQFSILFSESGEEFQFTPQNIRDAIGRLEIDGMPYSQRYGIQVNEDNYEMAAFHVVNNFRNGEIARSYLTDSPMRAILHGSDPDKSDDLTVVLPKSPPMTDKPSEPSLFVKFFGMFGFFQYRLSKYQSDMEDYKKAAQALQTYETNSETIQRNVDVLSGKSSPGPDPSSRRAVDFQSLQKQEVFGTHTKRTDAQDTSRESTKEAATEVTKETKKEVDKEKVTVPSR